ncbi:hypothetical protein BDV98DRAFT_233668 [Pterulicium gracile]|uniref:Uncharacterized protein n=1 Tax=Pterulicium gracile TaxID=1884261 RepID=A0A5C3QWP0_9AGAR|nr:hypothetical protein BDV98DRAFT_233668 [Pterula gracilis]
MQSAAAPSSSDDHALWQKDSKRCIYDGRKAPEGSWRAGPPVHLYCDAFADFEQSRCPCFLLSFAGPWMYVSGAVFPFIPIVQRLDVQWAG